jgi:large subunit ribosomal protein L35
MPKLKLKTHSGTKDRFRVTKNGRVRARHSGKNHFLQKKSGARKRKLAGLDTLEGANSKTVKLRIGA